MESSDDHRFAVCRPRIIDEIIDGEVVAINLDTGVYYSLRDVAAVIWSGIDGGASASEIASAISGRDGAAAMTADVVAQFTDELMREGLVEIAPAAGAGQWQIDGLPAKSRTPVLERFTDLEDLLLLDPIHDVDTQGWPHTTPKE